MNILSGRGGHVTLVPVLGAFIAVFWVLFTAPGQAQIDDSAYRVTGVPVDVTAATAVQARTIAIRRGQRAAFDLLLRRMTLAEDRERLPAMTDRQIEGMVDSIAFENERYSSTRYMADLNVGFFADQVRGMLQRAGLPFAEALGRPIVVVPVYQDGGVTMLWDDPNPWRTAWQQSRRASSLLPFVMPDISVNDPEAISSFQAVSGSKAALERFAMANGTSEALVPLARWTIDLATGNPVLEIDVRLHGLAGLQRWTLNVSQRDDEREDVFLKRAAGEVSAMLAQAWKQRAMVSGGQQSDLSVVADLTKLDDLLLLKQRLSQAPMVRSVEIEGLSTSRAVLALRIAGELEQVSDSLAQYGIDLNQSGSRWQISLRR